ncbi:MAG TPA: hypothetical protein VF603_04915 [Allosphingosinicella sp.]|jgi:hypothetical protein
MSLDFAILGESGTPVATVPMNPLQHHVFMKIASDLSLSVAERVFDYYEDAEFTPSELPELIRQFDLVRASEQAKDIIPLLNELDRLVRKAAQSQASIYVIAD